MRKEPVSGFSATPGCLIIVCGLLGVFGFLVWGGYTLVKQNGEIDAFTTNSPITIVPIEVSNEKRDGFIDKLQQFQTAVVNSQPAQIALTAEELNVLLTLEPFSEVNTLIQIEKIDSDAIQAQISFILNALPPGNVRYLNGTLLFEPAINTEIGLVLNTTDILVPGKDVAEGFLRRYRQDGYLDTMLVEEFRDEDMTPGLAEVLREITDVEIKDDTVIISYNPALSKK